MFIWLLLSKESSKIHCAWYLFLIAAATDWYDGWYARKYNASTRFGIFLDPLADKILVGSAMFAFALLDYFSMFLVIITIGRDFYVTLLRIVAEKYDLPVKTSKLAKWKTFLQMIFIWLVLFAFVLTYNSSLSNSFTGFADLFLDKDVLHVGMIILSLLSVITAVQYTLDNKETIKKLF